MLTSCAMLISPGLLTGMTLIVHVRRLARRAFFGLLHVLSQTRDHAPPWFGSALTVSCARPSAMSRILTTVCFRPRLSPSAWNLQAQDDPAQVAIFGVSCGLSSRLRPFVYWLRNPRTRGYGVSQAWQKQRLLLPAGLRPRHGNRKNIHVCCTVLIRPRLGVQGSQFVFERKKNEK